jgi:hypothetical protein
MFSWGSVNKNLIHINTVKYLNMFNNNFEYLYIFKIIVLFLFLNYNQLIM